MPFLRWNHAPVQSTIISNAVLPDGLYEKELKHSSLIKQLKMYRFNGEKNIVYLLELSMPVNRVLNCWPKEQFLALSFLVHRRRSITRGSNGTCDRSICRLLEKCHIGCMISMKQSLPLFTSFKIFAVHAFTIFRAKNIGLEALTVLLEATWFLAVASFVMFCQD